MMKKKKVVAICMIVLIALLSAAFFRLRMGYKENVTNPKEENLNNAELTKELLAAIRLPDDDEKDINIAVQQIHVSEDEEKIYILAARWKTSDGDTSGESTIDGTTGNESASDETISNESAIDGMTGNKITSDKTIDNETVIYEFENQYLLYEISKENGKYGEPVIIDTEGHYIEKMIWDGDRMYFYSNEISGIIEDNETSGIFEDNGTSGIFEDDETQKKATRNQVNIPLYSAKIQNGHLTDIQPVKIEQYDDNEYDYSNSYNYFSIYKGKLFWYQELISDVNNESDIMPDRKFYIGTMNETIHGQEVVDLKEVEGFNHEDGILNFHFADDEKTALVELVYMQDDSLGGMQKWTYGYEMVNFADDKTNRTKLDFDENTEFTYPVFVWDINRDSHTFYYEVDDFYIYKIQYNESVQEIFNLTDDNNPFAISNQESENDNNSKREIREYHSGDYSYDEYDVGNFELQLRNKSEQSQKAGVYYEIFVRSFADSDGDGIGDFNGITEKLDYLKELGIDGIWLMPVNESPSYHGYDVTDYMKLNSEYGTEEDFQRMLDEAHKRNIKVIMDFVVNHTSNEHPWFVSAAGSVDSKYRNYYRWVAENDSMDYSEDDVSNWGSPVWNQVGDSYYYGMFGYDIPDLNFNNPNVRDEIKKAAGKWLSMGVDGFRLDAAMHIYGTNEFKQQPNPTESTLQWWNEFALYCESINPNVYLVGEAWQDMEVLEEYVQPFDTKFNFAFEQVMMQAVKENTAVPNSAEGKNIAQVLGEILKEYDSADTNYLDGIFGTNHDQNRMMSQLGDDKKARLAANIYMTLSGNPFIYYGEELGMYGKKPDEMIRTPFLWSKSEIIIKNYNTSWIEDSQNTNTIPLDEQMKDVGSMYHFYKNLIAVRKSNDALTNGDYKAADFDNEFIMAYERESENQKVLVIHNLSAKIQKVDLSGYHVKGVVYECENDKMENKEMKNNTETEQIAENTQNEKNEIKMNNGILEINGESSVIIEIE